MTVVQVGILGVLGVIIAVLLKEAKASAAIYMCIAISLFLFIEIFNHLKTIVQCIKEISEYVNVEETYISTLLKMLGITYIAEFASGICKDAGFSAIATQIELFGKITILLLSLPILLAMLNMIKGLLA